jgi:hypothetical protein
VTVRACRHQPLRIALEGGERHHLPARRLHRAREGDRRALAVGARRHQASEARRAAPAGIGDHARHGLAGLVAEHPDVAAGDAGIVGKGEHRHLPRRGDRAHGRDIAGEQRPQDQRRAFGQGALGGSGRAELGRVVGTQAERRAALLQVREGEVGGVGEGAADGPVAAAHGN